MKINEVAFNIIDSIRNINTEGFCKKLELFTKAASYTLFVGMLLIINYKYFS